MGKNETTASACIAVRGVIGSCDFFAGAGEAVRRGIGRAKDLRQNSPADETPVLRLRDSNPEFVAGAKALVGYPYDDFQPEHAKWLIEKKKAAEKAGGTAYWDSILDKLNIETCLANRVAMAPYLDPKRFHWVFFVDSFLFPFDNRDQTGKNPDMGVYIPLQEKVLHRYMQHENVSGLPADLAAYEAFVRQTLTDNQKKGGVAMKFEAAYFRSLYFSDPPREKAAAIYAKYRAGGVPSNEDYRTFQDYIFRVLIDQDGKLNRPGHFPFLQPPQWQSAHPRKCSPRPALRQN